MYPEEILKSLAASLAEKLAKKVPELEVAYKNAGKELETAKAANHRSQRYVPIIEGKAQCPHCAIVSNQSADMVQIEAKDRQDIYRCTRCRTEYPIRW